MSDLIDYVMLTKNEANLKNKEIIIDGIEAELLLEHRDVFTKFLNKSKFSYQIELSRGSHRWKEENLYTKMEAMDELISTLDNFDKAFKKYLNK